MMASPSHPHAPDPPDLSPLEAYINIPPNYLSQISQYNRETLVINFGGVKKKKKPYCLRIFWLDFTFFLTICNYVTGSLTLLIAPNNLNLNNVCIIKE